MKKQILCLSFILVVSAFAADPTPAQAAPEAVPAQTAKARRPGRPPREMSPEVKEYYETLDRIRKERDAQGRLAAQAEADMKARKADLAKNDEKAAKLQAEVDRLTKELDAAKAALEEFFAADEGLKALSAAKQTAERAKTAKQAEMNQAVSAAMKERHAKMRAERNALRDQAEGAAQAASEAAPAPEKPAN